MIIYIRTIPKNYLKFFTDTMFEHANIDNKDNDVIDLMFAGNIGKAQSVDTIIRAASLLRDDPRYKFHIVGNGSELHNMKKLSAKLKTDNVIFYGQQLLEEMPSFYKIADAMLVTLEDKTYANMTIPGKVQSYMAVGKPIIGAINGSCSTLIKDNEIGYTCPSGDSEALANLIKNLNINELKTIGKHAKEVYFRKYCKSIFMNKLISTLENMKK